MARQVASILSQRGFHTVLTRDRDVFIEKEDRAAVANRCNADLFVSIHADSSESRSLNGFTVYTARGAGRQSRWAARAIVEAMTRTGLDSNGVGRRTTWSWSIPTARQSWWKWGTSPTTWEAGKLRDPTCSGVWPRRSPTEWFGPWADRNVTQEPLEVILDRMGRHFCRPRTECVGRTLGPHVQVDKVPAAPEQSMEICQRHLPGEHPVPRFFQVQAEIRGRMDGPDLQSAYDRIGESYDEFWLSQATGPPQSTGTGPSGRA